MAATMYGVCESCDSTRRLSIEQNMCRDCLLEMYCFSCMESGECQDCSINAAIDAIDSERTHNSLAVIAGLDQNQVAALYAMAS